MSDWNKRIIKEFRANEGRVGGAFANNSLLLLHTVGAKSGKDRVNPLVTFEDKGRLVIIGGVGVGQGHIQFRETLPCVIFLVKGYTRRDKVQETESLVVDGLMHD